MLFLLAMQVLLSGSASISHRMTDGSNTCPHYRSDASVQRTMNNSLNELLELIKKYSPSKGTQPSKKVAYFKTHKTGSSTMQALIINFARKYNLHPINGVVDLGEHVGLHMGCPKQVCIDPLRHAFDTEFRHLITTPNFLKTTSVDPCYSFPGFFDDVVQSYECLIDHPQIITSFRDPVSQFLSCFGYYSYHHCSEKAKQAKGKHCSAQALRQTELGYVKSVELHLNSGLGKDGHLNYNLASRDFGLASEEDAKRFVSTYIDSGKLRIIVLERLFESLVILRRQLGWSFADVLHMRTNSVSGSSRNLTIDNQTHMDELKHRIASHVHQDYMIYHAAVAKTEALARNLSAHDPSFDEEVFALQHAVKDVSRLCGCTEFLFSDAVSNAQSTFDLVHFCEGFGESEMTREKLVRSSTDVKQFNDEVRLQLDDASLRLLTKKSFLKNDPLMKTRTLS